jgi:hypothetical protein
MSMGNSTHPVSRRAALQAGAFGLLGVAATPSSRIKRAAAGIAADAWPKTPLEIGHDPQFLFDLHVVDCTWGVQEKSESVKRVFHAARKHGDAPLLSGDQPSHFTVMRDDDGTFRLWYQLNHRLEYPGGRPKGQAQFHSYCGYAQSTDGLEWERPELNLFPQATDASLPKNCILYRPDSPTSHFDCPQLLRTPERDRRGYRYLLTYLGGGSNTK